MNKNISLSILLFAIALMVSCRRSSDYMIFEKIRYVNTFPQTFLLNNGDEVDIENMNVMGVNDFRIHDSLLILSTTDREGLWSFLSLPDHRFLGKFLTLGQGPYEFFETPAVGQGDVNFFKENDELFATIYHFHKGELYKINIDESINQNQLFIKTIHDSLPPQIFDFIMIDNSTFFSKELNDKETQQIRHVSVNGKKTTPSYFEKLNSVQIKDNEDINILSTNTKYDLSNRRFVEVPTQLNYINMYSIDGSFGKTICIGKQLDHIGEIQDKNYTDRMDTFSDLRLFPRFWGVVFINELSYIKERKQLPSILLFDWNGEPLAQLKLNNFAHGFDIDFVNGHLYTLDRKTDAFYIYDIREILNKI